MKKFIGLVLIIPILFLSCKKVTKSVNESPIAAFTFTPESGTTTTIFSFDASSSSDEEDTSTDLEVRWDFENDGTFDTNFSTNKTTLKLYSTPGTYTVKLEVKDTDGDTSSTTNSVNVIQENTAPTASFTVDPESGTTATIFNFDASGSSDEEDTPTDLEVRWDFENDGTWDSDFRSIKTIIKQFLTPGIYTVILEVRDTEGLTNIFTKAVTVEEQNTAPTASFTVDPESGTTATVFNFDASGSSDAEDAVSDLQVRWDFEDDGTWDTDYSTTKTTNHQYATEGVYSVKMEVMDVGGLVDVEFKNVAVSASNTAPVASFTVSPSTGTTATVFSFDGSGSSDAEDAVSDLQVRWDFEDDGTWDTGYSTTKTTTHQYSSDGTYTVRMEVKDTHTWVTSTTNTVVVYSTPNTQPVASFTINPSTGDVSTIFWFDGSGSSDAEDGNALQYRWDWENDGVWDTGYHAANDATHQFTTAGTYTVKLGVQDSGGLINSTTRTVTVTGSSNTAPVASFTINPSAADVSTTFWFDGSGSNDAEDGNALSYRWDFEDDGTWDTSYRSANDATHQYSSAGTYSVKLEVMDSQGWTNTTFRNVTVTSSSNTAPVASFTINPSTADVSTTFWFDGSGSNDAEDGNALSYRWDFEDDGTWDTSYRSANDATHQYASAGTYSVKLEVRDSQGWTNTTFRNVTVTSGNTAPTAAFTIFPSTADVSTTFWFDGSGSSDAEDGTPSEYRWDFENDGTWDIDWRIAHDATHQFSLAGIYTVKLEVKDSQGLTHSTTQTVTVTSANTAPTAAFTAYLSGVPATSGSTADIFWLDASASTDAEEGTPSEYRWDFENDGIWDIDWRPADEATYQFPTAGTYVVKLEVRDSQLWTNSTTRTLTINP